MALNGYFIEKVRYQTVKPFIEQWHYSHSTNGIKIGYCFALFRPSPLGIPELVGAAIFGEPAMNNQASSWNPTAPDKCIELRRLCCIDDTPKNTESFFIGQMIRWLRYNTDIEVILSYADPNYGHEGTIYKATNFEHVGMTAPGKVLLVDGKQYHDRTLRSKKPYGARIRQQIADGSADIKLVDTPPKHIYLFRIVR
jgi:hypothetical protein